MSDSRAFRWISSLIRAQTNNTSAAKDTGGWKAQHQPPLFYSITHLVPRHIKALDGPNKLPHDIYLGLMDRKCVALCVSICVCFSLIINKQPMTFREQPESKEDFSSVPWRPFTHRQQKLLIEQRWVITQQIITWILVWSNRKEAKLLPDVCGDTKMLFFCLCCLLKHLRCLQSRIKNFLLPDFGFLPFSTAARFRCPSMPFTEMMNRFLAPWLQMSHHVLSLTRRQEEKTKMFI